MQVKKIVVLELDESELDCIGNLVTEIRKGHISRETFRDTIVKQIRDAFSLGLKEGRNEKK